MSIASLQGIPLQMQILPVSMLCFGGSKRGCQEISRQGIPCRQGQNAKPPPWPKGHTQHHRLTDIPCSRRSRLTENTRVLVPFHEFLEQSLTLGVSQLPAKFVVLFWGTLHRHLIASRGAGETACRGRVDPWALPPRYFVGPRMSERCGIRYGD